MPPRSGSGPGSFLAQWFRKAPQPERLREAREKAEEYQSAPDDPAPDHAARPSLASEAEWSDVVGRRIEEAMRAGAFDHLPGRGKPLNLDREPFVPEDRQMAHRLLRNNDLTPAWIGERAELLSQIDRLRARLASAHAWRRREIQAAASPAEREQAEARWQHARDRFAHEIHELNKRILTLNLKQPVAHLEVHQLRLDEEIARLDGSEGASPIAG